MDDKFTESRSIIILNFIIHKVLHSLLRTRRKMLIKKIAILKKLSNNHQFIREVQKSHKKNVVLTKTRLQYPNFYHQIFLIFLIRVTSVTTCVTGIRHRIRTFSIKLFLFYDGYQLSHRYLS